MEFTTFMDFLFFFLKHFLFARVIIVGMRILESPHVRCNAGCKLCHVTYSADVRNSTLKYSSGDSKGLRERERERRVPVIVRAYARERTLRE